MSKRLENLRLADSITGKVFLFPKNSPCAACGSQQDESNKKTKLVIDHDRWLPCPDLVKPTIIRYRTRLLCLQCNLRKGNRRYVSFKDGTYWLPGMKPATRITSATPRKIVVAIGWLGSGSKLPFSAMAISDPPVPLQRRRR